MFVFSVVLAFSLAIIQGFLIDVSQSNGTRSQTDIQRIEQLVLHLMTEFQKLKEQTVKDSTQILKLETKNNGLEKELHELKLKYAYMKLENSELQRNISANGNETFKVKQTLDQIKTTNSIINNSVTSVGQRMDSLDYKMKAMIVSSTVRNNNFLATIHQTNVLAREAEGHANANDAKMASMQTFTSHKVDDITDRLSNITHTVAMSSCTSFTEYMHSQGEYIKFPRLTSSFGITKIKDFLHTGNFVCESAGIYLITVTLNSDSNDASFYLSKNDFILQYSYSMVYYGAINGQDGIETHSGTSTVVVHIDTGDAIQVQSEISMKINRHSCITIIKIG